MIFVAIPLEWLELNQPKFIRTPEYTIVTPTAKFIALITAYKYGLISPDKVATNIGTCRKGCNQVEYNHS